MSSVEKRRWSALVVVVGLFVGLLAVAGVNQVTERSANAGISAKHTICHRTASTTNPYRRITVSINAIYSGNSGGFKNAKHPIHNDYAFKTYDSNNNGILSGSELTNLAAVHPYDNTFFGFPAGRITTSNGTVSAVTLVTFGGNGHPTTDNVFRAGINYPPNQKKWGDIIPPYQSSWNRLNYGTEGEAIFSGATSGCRRMSALEFIQSEQAAGQLLSQIAADLDEQGATEDLTLRQTLGGSFSQWVASNPGASIDDLENAVVASGPAVDTLDAANVLTTSAQLRGHISPRGIQTTFFFQWATSSAGVPDATRYNTGMKINGVNATNSNSTSHLPVTVDLTGLTNGTTYYYRIIGVSSVTDPDSANDTVESVIEGDIVSFTMGAVSAATTPESGVGNTSATLNGTGSPNSTATTFYFQYGLATSPLPDPAANQGSLINTGMTIGGTANTTSSASSAVSISMAITGLAAGTTYHYRIVGQHSGNTYVVGELEQFTTSGGITVTTEAADDVTRSTATLNGSVEPNQTEVTVYFQWSTSFGGVSGASEANSGLVIDGTPGTTTSASASVSAELPLTGLSPGTTYYFKILARSVANSSLVYLGEVLSFTTTADPSGTTTPESNLTQTSATLNGTVTPNSIQTDLYFQWSTTSQGVTISATVSAGMSIGGSLATSSASPSSQNVSMGISGLTAGTTYYYRLVGYFASNGTLAFAGSIEDFTTGSPSGQNNNGNNAPVVVPTTAPPTTVGRSGPPARPNGGGGNGGGGPQPTDPRTGNNEPIEQNVNVQVGPNLPGGGGGGGGSIRITPQENEPPLELLDANIEDPDYEIEVVRSGVDYNKPSTWVADGFGDECWKIEPGGSSYVLPNPPTPPSGKTGAAYSAIKVKAGSLTSDDPNFQVNTVFLDPAPGTMVWPDSNKDGVYNPGGRTGDKDISHVILCVRFGGPSTPTTAAPATAPTTTTTRAPSTTAAPTTTRAPSTTAAPTTAAPTTTRAPSTTAAPTTAAPTTTRAPSTTAAPTTAAPNTTAAPTTAAPTTSSPNTTATPTTSAPTTAAPTTAAPTTATPAIPTTSVPEGQEEIEIDIRRKQELPSDSSTTTADGPRNRKITLVVTNGLKQSTLELVVDLDRFVMTAGNVPLPTLPKTGSTSNQPIQLALATIAFGAFLVVIRRRLRNV